MSKSALCVMRTFQFTPLREGRHAAGFAACGVGISIHAPPRGATAVLGERADTRRISIHAPPRGATTPQKIFLRIILFQFTPLREGRPATVIGGITALLAFQFTPLREGRLAVLGKRADTRRISIHAPPRGATSTMHRIMSMDIISIHAPPRGAT